MSWVWMTCTCTVSTRQGFRTGKAWLYVLRIMYMHNTQQVMNCMCSITHRTPHTTHTHTHPHPHPTTHPHPHPHTNTNIHTAHGHHHGTIPQHDLVMSSDLDTVSNKPRAITQQHSLQHSCTCTWLTRQGRLEGTPHCTVKNLSKHNDHRTVIPASCV